MNGEILNFNRSLLVVKYEPIHKFVKRFAKHDKNEQAKIIDYDEYCAVTMVFGFGRYL